MGSAWSAWSASAYPSDFQPKSTPSANTVLMLQVNFLRAKRGVVLQVELTTPTLMRTPSQDFAKYLESPSANVCSDRVRVITKPEARTIVTHPACSASCACGQCAIGLGCNFLFPTFLFAALFDNAIFRGFHDGRSFPPQHFKSIEQYHSIEQHKLFSLCHRRVIDSS